MNITLTGHLFWILCEKLICVPQMLAVVTTIFVRQIWFRSCFRNGKANQLIVGCYSKFLQLLQVIALQSIWIYKEHLNIEFTDWITACRLLTHRSGWPLFVRPYIQYHEHKVEFDIQGEGLHQRLLIFSRRLFIIIKAPLHNFIGIKAILNEQLWLNRFMVTQS